MIVSKNNPENNEISYVATVKFYVKAKDVEDAKIQLIEKLDDSIDWCFDTVVHNAAESFRREIELARLSQK